MKNYSQQEQVFFIHFKFRPDFSEQGGDPIALFRNLRELGKLTIIPHTAAVPPLEECNPKQLYLRWTVKLVTPEPQFHIEKILTPVIADTENDIKIESITLPPPDPSQPMSEKEVFELPKVISKEAQEPSPFMLVKIGKNIFAIARSVIIESQQLDIEPATTNQEELIEVKGETIPLLRLHRLFRSQPDSENEKTTAVIIVEQAKQKLGILVDEVIQQPLMMTKEIDENFGYMPGISGASLLDNGKLALAFDIEKWMAKVR